MTNESILWAAREYAPRVAQIQQEMGLNYTGGYLSIETVEALEKRLDITEPPLFAPSVANLPFISDPKDPRDMVHSVVPFPLGPRLITIPEEWYPGIQSYSYAASDDRSHLPNTLIIHGTAGSSSAGAVSVIKARKASFHWLVPDEDEAAHGVNVWACVPEKRAAWHVRNIAGNPLVNGGNNRCNDWSLGVEVVNRQNHKDPFSDWQVEMTAQIAAYAYARYGIKWIASHAAMDPSRREDPTLDFPWVMFLQRFYQILTTEESKEVPLAVSAEKVAACEGEHPCGIV